MADNIESRIGFEASDAVKILESLAKAVDQYTSSLKANPRAVQQFNRANSFEQALEAQNKILNSTVQNLKAYTDAERNAAKAAADAAAQTRRAAEIRQTAQSLDRRREANRVREQILQRANLPGADPKAIAALDAAIAKVQQLVRTSNSTASRVQRINANLGKSYEGTGRRIRDALLGVESALDRVNNGTARSGTNLNRLEGQLGRTLNAFVRYRVVAGIFSSLEQQIRESIDTARQLELRLAEIQTISPEFRIRGLDNVQSEVRRISEQFGIDQLEVARGLYQTLSNQIGNAAQSTQFLSEAARFSRATITSLGDSVDLLSGILNAYGLEAQNASRVSDVLFKTIELGRVRGEELAANFGNITTQAAQLGIPLEEVGAAISTLTIQGVKADTAMTGLQNIFIKLIRPSTGLKSALDQIGVSSIRAGIQTFGLIGFLVELEKTTNGTIEELGNLFPRIRALRGSIGLLNQEGQKATDTFNRLRDEFKGASEDAANIVLETEAAKFEKNVETIKNAFTADIGRPLLEAFNSLIELVGGAANASQILTSLLRTLGPVAALAIGGVALSNVVALTRALAAGTFVARGFSAAVALVGGPFAAAAIAGVLAIGIALAAQRDHAADLREELAALQKDTEKRIKDINKANTEAIEAEKKAVRDNSREVLLSLRDRQKAFQQNRDSAIRFQEQVTDSLKDQLSERLTLVNRLVSAVVKAQDNARKEIESLTRNQLDFEFQINQGRFERNLDAIERPAQRAQALIRRSNELVAAARRAERGGNTEFSLRLIEEAARQAERAAGIAGQRRAGEAQINRVLSSRQQLNKRLIAQEQQKARLAAEQENAIRQQAISLRRDIENFNRQSAELTKGVQSGDFNEQEITRRRQDLERLGSSIETQLQSIGKSGLDILLGQSQALQLLNRPFRDAFTGEPIPLNFAIEDSVKRLVNTLKQQVEATPLQLRLTLEQTTGLPLGVQGFAPTIDTLAKQTAEVLTAKDNVKGLTAAQIQLEAANKGVKTSLDALINAFNDNALRSVGPYANANARNNVLAISQLLKQLRTRVVEATTAGDFDAILPDEARLQRLQKVLASPTDPLFGDKDLQNQAQVVAQILGQIETARKAQENLNKQQQAFVQGESSASRIEALKTALTDQTALERFNQLLQNSRTETNNLSTTGIAAGAALSAATNAAIEAQRTLRSETERTTRALLEQGNLSNLSNAGGAVQGRAKGGPIMYLQGGGFVPRGTDTQPAMLSPDEFVVNASSSRRFYSELVSMNAGRPPIYRQEGGPVTNNSFTGDINLNVSAPNGVVNGREAANQIRRELRRNTAKLR